ncbi:MAG: heme biosynthesis HemY N-terminal domain-containing protein [Bdellovibrionales bacterium]|jgi:HemY protein
MKKIGFLLRLVLVIGLVVWLADRPGTAQIVWHDTVIETSAAVLAVMAVAILYMLVLLYRLWRGLVDGPRFWRLKRKIGAMEEGQGELSKGMASLAAGQATAAGRHAVKARKLLGELPVTQLLLAQSAQLAGDHKTARSLFQAMTKDEATAVLGYRGLITAALRAGDYEEAARQAQLLEGLKKDVPWLHLVRFEAAAKLENWRAAQGSLEKARKGRALPAAVADEQQATLLLAEAKNALRESLPKKALELAEKAKKLRPDWLPVTLVLAEAQIVAGHARAALRGLERAWERHPNGQLVPLALWAAGAQKPMDALKQVERLTRSTRETVESHRAVAEAALKADLWGEARRHLMALVGQGRATTQTYQILARLEQKENHDEKAAAAWLAKAVSAPAEARWQCTACGAAHETWEATCPHCEAFNRLEWGVAGQARAASENRPLALEFL